MIEPYAVLVLLIYDASKTYVDLFFMLLCFLPAILADIPFLSYVSAKGPIISSIIYSVIMYLYLLCLYTPNFALLMCALSG